VKVFQRFRALGLLLALAACGDSLVRDTDAGNDKSPPASAVVGVEAGNAAAPWPEHVPRADTLSGDSGAQIQHGLALLTHTRDSLPAHVGNALRCVTCHLDEGRRANALPWVGVLARFPQYRTRNAVVNQIEDRVNDCFERSLAGRALPSDSEQMRAIVAYFEFLSRGVPYGRKVQGQGAPALPADVARTADVANGARVYAASCVRCHGASGEGTALAPPLWGARSYANGAGMGRPRTAAAFIHANMPLDGATLSAQQAFDVATFINVQPRPVFARASADWPFGGAPVDVPYATAGRAAGVNVSPRTDSVDSLRPR
jgi:thiosulfate dehydrogenase